jgi:outer membrane cobalamin receptor
VWSSLALSCFAFVPWALAQEGADTPQIDAEIEEVVVTGSRIKRRDFFTPSPLMTISEEEIEFSGQWTLEETLNQMPQVTPDYGRASNNPGNGMATVALRNMGPGRSLVLLNGRRIGSSGNRGYVDINNIPQALVERVEIITGGTSAVYGSDALAGVVNFITRDDFEGFAVDASASVTEYGDAESYDLSLTYGRDLAGGRGNIAVYAAVLLAGRPER